MGRGVLRSGHLTGTLLSTKQKTQGPNVEWVLGKQQRQG